MHILNCLLSISLQAPMGTSKSICEVKLQFPPPFLSFLTLKSMHCANSHLSVKNIGIHQFFHVKNMEDIFNSHLFFLNPHFQIVQQIYWFYPSMFYFFSLPSLTLIPPIPLYTPRLRNCIPKVTWGLLVINITTIKYIFHIAASIVLFNANLIKTSWHMPD